MRDEPLRLLPVSVGAVSTAGRKAEANAADTSIARHAAMANRERVLDALRRENVSVESGLANDAPFDERTSNNGLVERLLLYCDRPGIPNMMLKKTAVYSGFDLPRTIKLFPAGGAL